MKKLANTLLSGLVVLSLGVAATAEKYNVDVAHSMVGFTATHLGLSEIDGRFTDFTGTIDFDPKAPEKTAIAFTAQATSVNTHVAKRDDHLRSADFFEVEKYPTLSFKSSKVSHLGEDRYKVDGDLTIHGVTKAITTTAQIKGPKEAMGETKIGFRTTFKIDRIEYKVGDNAKMSSDTMIGHEIFITIKGEAAKAK